MEAKSARIGTECFDAKEGIGELADFPTFIANVCLLLAKFHIGVTAREMR